MHTMFQVDAVLSPRFTIRFITYLSKFPPVYVFFLWLVCQDYTFVTVEDSNHFKPLLYHIYVEYVCYASITVKVNLI